MNVDIKDSELLACPFCGDAPQIERDGRFEDVACLNIYCLVQPRALGASTRSARETWNGRRALTRLSFTMRPGDVSATRVECANYRERLRFAWHFLKVAGSFMKPSRTSVTSNIIQGPIIRS